MDHLLKAAPGASRIVAATPSEVETALRPTHKSADDVSEVRFLRGRKMTTKAGLLDEFAAALQFHHHFGENWDALRDALSSLPLLKSGSLLVCVLDAPEVLKASTPEDRETLARVLHQVRDDAAAKKHSLQWVWQVASTGETDLREKWGKLGLV